MACNGSYASVQDYVDFWCLGEIGSEAETMIRQFLEIAVSDVHAALAATGACDCTLAGWATEYLKKLQVIEAAVIYNCPCGTVNLTDDMKRNWLEWLNGQYKMLRTGEIEVCDGETGADFPSMGWAEQAWTDWNRAQVVYNDLVTS